MKLINLLSLHLPDYIVSGAITVEQSIELEFILIKLIKKIGLDRTVKLIKKLYNQGDQEYKTLDQCNYDKSIDAEEEPEILQHINNLFDTAKAKEKTLKEHIQDLENIFNGGKDENSEK